MIGMEGQKVLITGYSGFKGQWLALLLHKLGAQVYGVDLEVAPSRFFVDTAIFTKSEKIDIRDEKNLKLLLKKVQPNLVFHFAASSLVSQAVDNPVETWSTNVLGTLTLIRVLDEIGGCNHLVVASTDKVYASSTGNVGFVEEDDLKGQEHYSGSKVAMESAIVWEILNKSRSINISIVRSGNVIGGGDRHLTRLLPGTAESISSGTTLTVRNLEGVRPWLHVLDSLWGYLLISQSVTPNREFPKIWNIGPESREHYSNIEILQEVKKMYPEFSYARQENAQYHETEILKLDSSKIRNQLGWNPLYKTSESLAITLSWYLSQEIREVRTEDQVQKYLQKQNKVKKI